MDDLLDRRRLLTALGGGALTGSVAGAVGAVAGCLGPPRGERVVVTEGFEAGLDDWELRGHVGPDAGDDFAWYIETSDERAATGSRSLAVFTEGSHDDGTAWIARAIPVVEGTAYDVTGSVRAYAASESFNTVRHLVFAVGPEPTTEADFPAPDADSSGTPDLPAGGLRAPLDREAGWSTYEFSWSSPPLSTDRVHLAVGVSVVWETDRTDFLDDVRVVLVPRE